MKNLNEPHSDQRGLMWLQSDLKVRKAKVELKKQKNKLENPCLVNDVVRLHER